MRSFLSLVLVSLAAARTCNAGPHEAITRRAQEGVPTVATAWYGAWTATSNPPAPISKISWSKYTHLTYSFALTTPDVAQLNLSGANPDLLPTFVDEAHKHGVKVLVSIGGWAGSQYWSSNVGSAANRTAFVNAVTSLVSKYRLDGLDFDWEYPARQGIGCNIVTPDDTANFLAFVQELRQHPVGANLVLSAATSIIPFPGITGTPSPDIPQFGDLLDWIAIMNYDIYGSWSTAVGPNAPLDDSCAPSKYQQGSATSAVKAWEAAGMPLSKIVLGVAGYGHSFTVIPSNAFSNGSLAAYPPFDASDIPQGDTWTSGPGIDQCGNLTPRGDTVDFWGMIDLGYLDAKGKPRKNIAYRFDACSKTAYAYNQAKKIMVSFDDASAFSAKGVFIKSSALRGFALWQAGSDYHDILLDAIRTSAGFD